MTLITEADGLKEIAEKMNGREYREEITKDEDSILEALGVVVAFGYSDDNIEFRGAVNDEVGAYVGSETIFTAKGILRNKCENEDCPNFEEIKKHLEIGTVSSEMDSNGYTHEITADFPHETFEIFEEGEKYCKGIVFLLARVMIREDA